NKRRVKTGNPLDSPQENFIRSSQSIWPGLFDYSQVEYVRSQTKVRIICKKHGPFDIKPNKHLHMKRGCPKCGWEKSKKNSAERRINTEEVIERSKKTHGDKYDYSESVCFSVTEKLTIICPNHGEFQQVPADHMDGHGCKLCPVIISKSKPHEE